MLVDHLERTRLAYDTVAVDYARMLAGGLPSDPTDRLVLARFAAGLRGPVVEVGCGPGRMTGLLAELGLAVRGIDLSPEMVAEARRRHPNLDFGVGTMTALDVPDRSVAGLVAWYSIIHLPPVDRPVAFAEFARVLAPGGRLQLAFQVGDGPVEIRHAYGHAVSATAYRLDPDGIADLLRAAGFTVLVRQVRTRLGPETTPQAFLLAGVRSGRPPARPPGPG
ncbi:class I SAM-dependent DNA methyltransferase [Nakamurella sp.]|uniref:class I SAM-dependent DNA methyltransferase n=1 Tax=Nakamurella sp. TaxID=1869182 RepID=UPI00378498C0